MTVQRILARVDGGLRKVPGGLARPSVLSSAAEEPLPRLLSTHQRPTEID
jgi:hypothetical protein